MKIETLLYGIYPRSDSLRLDIGRNERGKIGKADLENEILKEKSVFYKMADGVDHCTDPLFNWHDIFRPVVLSVEGFQLGPLKRFIGTNTFYREPIIGEIGNLKIDPSKEYLSTENPPFPMFQFDSDNIYPILPTPGSLFEVSRNKENVKKDHFIDKISEIYLEILRKFGRKRVVLISPNLGKKEDFSGIDKISEKVFTILIPSSKINREQFNGKVGSAVARTAEDLSLAQEISVKPGIQLLDSRTTKVEKVDVIKNVLNTIERDYELKEMIVSHKDYMDFLPRVIADKKVEILKRLN